MPTKLIVEFAFVIIAKTTRCVLTVKSQPPTLLKGLE